MPQRDPLVSLLLRSVGWLIPCFALWWVAANFLSAPPGWLAVGVLEHGFGRFVHHASMDGHLLEVTTRLRPAPQPGQLPPPPIAFERDLLQYSMGLPLFIALMLAARGRGMVRQLLWGTLILILLQALGAVLYTLVKIAELLGPTMIANIGQEAWMWRWNLIASAHQLSNLIIPSLAPLVLWGWYNRGLIWPQGAADEAAADQS